jgi:hypothetical protein
MHRCRCSNAYFGANGALHFGETGACIFEETTPNLELTFSVVDCRIFAYVKFFCYATDTRNSKHYPRTLVEPKAQNIRTLAHPKTVVPRVSDQASKAVWNHAITVWNHAI